MRWKIYLLMKTWRSPKGAKKWWKIFIYKVIFLLQYFNNFLLVFASRNIEQRIQQRRVVLRLNMMIFKNALRNLKWRLNSNVTKEDVRKLLVWQHTVKHTLSLIKYSVESFSKISKRLWSTWDNWMFYKFL